MKNDSLTLTRAKVSTEPQNTVSDSGPSFTHVFLNANSMWLDNVDVFFLCFFLSFKKSSIWIEVLE